mmetsp:Transcript_67136/g.119183  ORF Transcript_67136/g.119183 Transcript_67136/m.119183 type:complete len:120 (+) Transcript_67136:391-750(+)
MSQASGPQVVDDANHDHEAQQGDHNPTSGNEQVGQASEARGTIAAEVGHENQQEANEANEQEGQAPKGHEAVGGGTNHETQHGEVNRQLDGEFTRVAKRLGHTNALFFATPTTRTRLHP